MNTDLLLSPSLVSFEDLSGLIETVDESIQLHSKAIAKYEDRLGVLLRGSGDSNHGINFDHDAKMPSVDNGSDEEIQQPKSDRKRRGGASSANAGETGWLVLEAEETSVKVATGSLASTSGKQVESLFKIIESLKAKLASLERIRKLISELPGQGFRANQSIVVMFRDGIPRQIIPANEVARAYKKFRYSEQFDVQVLA
jgi:hypothetical protein